jgi:hypothetical protein
MSLESNLVCVNTSQSRLQRKFQRISLPALVGTRREAIKCRVEIQDDTIATTTTKGDEKLILQKMAFKDRLGGAALEQRSRSPLLAVPLAPNPARKIDGDES